MHESSRSATAFQEHVAGAANRRLAIYSTLRHILAVSPLSFLGHTSFPLLSSSVSTIGSEPPGLPNSLRTRLSCLAFWSRVMTEVSIEYISASVNRFHHAASNDSASLIAYGAGKLIALWDTEVRLPTRILVHLNLSILT